MLLQALISLKLAGICTLRISEILKIPEHKELNNDITIPKSSICIENGTFSYNQSNIEELNKLFDSESNESKENTPKKEPSGINSLKDQEDEINVTEFKAPILNQINVNFSPNTFSCIIGKVGTGKSSLLMAMMNELHQTSGICRKNGTIAYIPQQPFLLNDTFKNNILFGKEFSKEKYNLVVKLCELEPDVEMFPGGHETEIGDRGINISGGQKQRVAIARALYSDSDIYVIDDCLSALDAYVGKKIFDNVLNGELKNKTKIMVTHQIHFIQELDQLILIDNGKIISQGKPKDVMLTEEFKNYTIDQEIQEHNKSQENSSESDNADEIKFEKNQDEIIEAVKNPVKKDIIDNKKLGTLTTVQKRFTGQVDSSVYKFYIKNGGYSIFLICLFLILVKTFLRFTADWWVGKWAEKEYSSLSDSQYIYIYAIITIVYLIIIFVKSAIFGYFSCEATYGIFNKLIGNVLKRKAEYFDTTPIGQTINLFSQDIEVLDQALPTVVSGFLECFFTIVGSIIFACVVTPILIVFVLVLIIILGFILKKFLKTSIELRRLQQMSFAPVLSRVSELMNGIVSIRTFGALDNNLKIWEKFHNLHKCILFHDMVASIWLHVRVELSIVTIVAIGGYLIVISKNFK